MNDLNDIKSKLEQTTVIYNEANWNALEDKLDKKEQKKVGFWWLFGIGAFIMAGFLIAFINHNNSTSEISQIQNEINKSNNSQPIIKKLDNITQIDDLENKNQPLISSENLSKINEEKQIRQSNPISNESNQNLTIKKNGIETKTVEITTQNVDKNANYSSQVFLSKSNLKSKAISEFESQNIFTDYPKTDENNLKQHYNLIENQNLNVKTLQDYYDLEPKFNSKITKNLSISELLDKEDKLVKTKNLNHYLNVAAGPTIYFNNTITKPGISNRIELSYQLFWKNKLGWSIGLGMDHFNFLVDNCFTSESVLSDDVIPNEFLGNCFQYNYKRNDLVIPINFSWKAIQKGRNSLLISVGIDNHFNLGNHFSTSTLEPILNVESQYLKELYSGQIYNFGFNSGLEYNVSISNSWIFVAYSKYSLIYKGISNTSLNGFQSGVGLKLKLK